MPREPIRIVTPDAEEVAAEHGYVIGLARIGYTRVVRREPIILCQRVHDWRIGVSDYLTIPFVLLNEEEEMVVPREARGLTIHTCRDKEAGSQERSNERPRYTTHIRIHPFVKNWR